MSTTWYPVIDYEKCSECGACVRKCTHGVYRKDKAPRPVVTYPEGCVQGCTGCGSLCPSGAISYFGAQNKAEPDGCGCSCRRR